MTQRLSYFPNLDALRAIAALAVIFAHLSTWFVYPDNNFYVNLKQVFSFGGNGGRFGVIFFFVLSGFLITYLLFLEQSKTGKKLKSFIFTFDDCFEFGRSIFLQYLLGLLFILALSTLLAIHNMKRQIG